MGVGQIMRDFSGWTSAHGIPHIGSAQGLCLRVFWSTVFLVSTAMFVLQFVFLIQKYAAYPVTVNTEMDTYIDFVKDPSAAEDPEGKFGFDDLKDDPIGLKNLAKDNMMLIAKANEEKYNYSLYSYDDFIMNCAYNTLGCNISDFKETRDPRYGNCYTFNYDTPPKYSSTRAGPLYGLRMLLETEQNQYVPLVESAGVRIAIHGQTAEPFLDTFGYNAAPGFTTSFGVKFVTTLRKSHPYGNCTHEKGTQPYYYEGDYSVEGCFRSCIQGKIKSDCGCSDPRFNSDDQNYCVNKDLDCIRKYVYPNSVDFEFSPLNECECPQSCNESAFGVTVSTALWPSDAYKPPVCTGPQEGKWSDEAGCRSWHEKHTTMVEVYYERMNYQSLNENEAYGIVNLISDMGGQLGLWMGVSFITVVEFLALTMLLCAYCCAAKKNNLNVDPEPDDEEPPKLEQ